MVPVITPMIATAKAINPVYVTRMLLNYNLPSFYDIIDIDEI